ncbi:uncharacterized protein KY384_004939 [Bacidia gigantensis]|uniref:uncharacterized protein n=1 Tax=Bacidia gigantensis TaxID=2732470 RepID=UPI001D04AAED|nr:uncharacterized protein KY384_004939 [Bacidia gigantensis]KAG8530437.1 hypothetical protein KY384_004939 [Bacidia gigantensis]
MAGPIAVPPPPPGAPQQSSTTQRTSDVIGLFRSSKCFKMDASDTLVTSLDFDDSGEFVLAACDDDSLQIYNAKEGKHVKKVQSQKFGAHLARFTHHPSSIIYASTKVNDEIRYLSTHDNQFLRYFRGHTAPVTCLAVCPGSDTFLSCSLDDTVRLWDFKSPSPQGRLNLLKPHLAAYDPSASVVAIASNVTHTVLLYDLRNYDKPPFATFDVRSYLPQQTVNSGKLDWTRLEFSNDGKSLLLGTNSSAGHLLLDAFEGTLRAHCVRSQAPTHLRATPEMRSEHRGQGDVCFSSDGRYVIGGSGGNHDAIVWDTHGQVEIETKQLKPLCGLPCKSKAALVEWNPRYNMCVTADREVIFWVPDEHVGLKPP